MVRMDDAGLFEARTGGARYLAPRRAGHQDPGATSSHLLLRAAAETFG